MIPRVQPEEFLRANDVQSSQQVLDYAAQQLGCPKPIGHAARGSALRRIKDEMNHQRWTWRHLTGAIDFMKKRGIKPRSFDFVYYHVEEAGKAGFLPRTAITSVEELQEAVSDAVYLETDDDWVRRLLSARGSSLTKVYAMWQEERGTLLEGL